MSIPLVFETGARAFVQDITTAEHSRAGVVDVLVEIALPLLC